MAEMTITVETARPANASAIPVRIWPAIAIMGFLGLVWLETINQLKAEWSVNPQYSYGWTVPLLVCYLLWKRWTERPDPGNPSSQLLGIALCIFAAFAFLPLRFVAEANPDWRLLSWSIALMAFTISLSLAFLAGGWPWARYFAFPFFFFLVAVPWPTNLEQLITQDLMRAVSAINVTLVNAIGIPAVQHGTVIEITSGLIGIEEACSGVRSLQATLMISLFLGELFSFRVWPRLLLILAGAVLAFVCNVGRTAFLIWIAARSGIHAMEGWHDSAGLVILGFCIVGLIATGMVLRRWSNPVEPQCGLECEAPFLNSNSLMRLVVPLAIWVSLVEGGVQCWYGCHKLPIDSSWTVNWPVSHNDYRSVPVAREAESLLGYDSGGAALWNGNEGHQWAMYYFRWLPGRTAARFVKFHRPDICLPASGMTMSRDNGIQLMTINGIDLPIRSYRFENGGVPLHVFYCYWDARSSYESEKAANEEDWTARGRVRAALRGRREAGAQMLEVVVWDYQDDAEATAALQRGLEEIVRKS